MHNNIIYKILKVLTTQISINTKMNIYIIYCIAMIMNKLQL